MDEQWITTKQASDFSGYHVNYIRQLARGNRIRFKKFGTTLQINQQSLLEYMQAAETSDDKRRGAWTGQSSK